jgi:hypothetical protein
LPNALAATAAVLMARETCRARIICVGLSRDAKNDFATEPPADKARQFAKQTGGPMPRALHACASSTPDELDFSTSSSPMSVIFKCGITGSRKATYRKARPA